MKAPPIDLSSIQVRALSAAARGRLERARHEWAIGRRAITGSTVRSLQRRGFLDLADPKPAPTSAGLETLKRLGRTIPKDTRQ